MRVPVSLQRLSRSGGSSRRSGTRNSTATESPRRGCLRQVRARPPRRFRARSTPGDAHRRGDWYRPQSSRFRRTVDEVSQVLPSICFEWVAFSRPSRAPVRQPISRARRCGGKHEAESVFDDRAEWTARFSGVTLCPHKQGIMDIQGRLHVCQPTHIQQYGKTRKFEVAGSPHGSKNARAGGLYFRGVCATGGRNPTPCERRQPKRRDAPCYSGESSTRTATCWSRPICGRTIWRPSTRTARWVCATTRRAGNA